MSATTASATTTTTPEIAQESSTVSQILLFFAFAISIAILSKLISLVVNKCVKRRSKKKERVGNETTRSEQLGASPNLSAPNGSIVIGGMDELLEKTPGSKASEKVNRQIVDKESSTVLVNQGAKTPPSTSNQTRPASLPGVTYVKSRTDQSKDNTEREVHGSTTDLKHSFNGTQHEC
ncbi:uncharacterized protein LOC143452207 [Clavelina lepadiformis]|uniref:Uncharacterized protein n=1 Tax=Clavelina lepadiformis TaxID=159417 RepID=A0ABP0G2H3_CLALP